MNDSSEWEGVFRDLRRNVRLTISHGLLLLAGLKPGEENRRAYEEPDRNDGLDIIRRVQRAMSPDAMKAEANRAAYLKVKALWDREGLAGDRFSVREYVEWAQAAGFVIPWLDTAVREGLLSDNALEPRKVGDEPKTLPLTAPSAVAARQGGEPIANLDAIKMRVQAAARIYFGQKPYPTIKAVMKTPGFLTAVNEGRQVSKFPASDKNVRAWISEIAPKVVRRGGRPPGRRNKPKPVPA